MNIDLSKGAEPRVLEGWLIRPDAEGSVRVQTGAIKIRDGVIESVEPGSPGLGHIILPGFVDAHAHLPQFHVVGHEGMTLLDWLADVVFPAEARWEDPRVAAEETSWAIKKLLSYGTTGFAAYATVHAEGARAAIQRARSANVRAWIGQTLMERYSIPELLRSREQLEDECDELCAFAPAGGRVAHSVNPRFAISCTAELLAGAGRIARERGALVQTHLAEMPQECELVAELFDNTPYAKVYDDAGLLGPHATLAHGVYLDEGQRALLAERDCNIAHCPTANTFLRSGAMDLAGLGESRVGISLGSDIGGGFEPSMPRVARAMIETAVIRGDTPPTAAQAWRLITRGNAASLGWPDGGQIEAGSPADLVVLKRDVDWVESKGDPLARLLWTWDERRIEATIVAGRVAYAG